MRRLTAGAIIAGGVMAVACAKPIVLKVDVATPEPAAVKLHLTKGQKPATPDECQTPCQVSVAPDTSHALSVRAPGYYPANMEFTYEQLRANIGATGKKEASLMVPLKQRTPPSAPDPQ